MDFYSEKAEVEFCLREAIPHVWRKPTPITSVNLHVLDIKVADNYKFLGVHLNSKFDYLSFVQEGPKLAPSVGQDEVFWGVDITEDLL